MDGGTPEGVGRVGGAVPPGVGVIPREAGPGDRDGDGEGEGATVLVGGTTAGPPGQGEIICGTAGERGPTTEGGCGAPGGTFVPAGEG